MVKKPSHNLRREHKWFKENNLLKQDIDLVLQIINKQYPQNKRHKLDSQYDTAVSSNPLTTRQPSTVLNVQSPLSPPAIPDNSITRLPNKCIYGGGSIKKTLINGNNSNSNDNNKNNNNYTINKQDINKQPHVKMLQSQGHLLKGNILPSSLPIHNSYEVSKNTLNSQGASHVKTSLPSSISNPTIHSKDRLIDFQSRLIKLLKAEIDLLTEKCDIMASTSLSEDSKKLQISEKIVPSIKLLQQKIGEQESKIENVKGIINIQNNTTRIPKNYTESTLSYNDSIFAKTNTDVPKNGSNSNISLPTPEELQLRGNETSCETNNSRNDIVRLFEDDEYDDSDEEMINDCEDNTSKDIPYEASVIVESTLAEEQQGSPPISKRQLRHRVPVNYRIPEKDDPFDYRVGRKDKALSQYELQSENESADAEFDDQSDYLSTREEERIENEKLHKSDIDFIVDDDADIVMETQQEKSPTKNENIEIILSSPVRTDSHYVEQIDLIDDNDILIESEGLLNKFTDLNKMDFIGHSNNHGSSDTNQVYPQLCASNESSRNSDNDDSDFDLEDSDLENFDTERENRLVGTNMKDVDEELKIISERKLNEEESQAALQFLNNIKKEHMIVDDLDELDDISLADIHTNQKEQTVENNSGEPWSSEVHTKLHDVFKLPGFRSNQEEAINATLSGKDVFVLMPTGGGKSLCYQLPAIVNSGSTHGTTVVISPLISLMQDQIEHLLSKNIKASMFSSKGTADERRQTFNLFIHGLLDIIYISPEMISASQQCKRAIQKLYENKKLARVVVDEAHCVSNWGHDFRPDYKELKMFKRAYPDIPMMALTATASKQVIMDIIHNLELNNPVFLKQSFNRTNLFYEVRKKSKNSIKEIVTEIKSKFRNQTGIIYCHSKKSCEQTSTALQKFGIRCAYYHAGMEPEDRLRVQKAWQSDQIKVICATVAFGMGIDKADVRFVYHFTVPRTLEGYYQETGRAGRDGKFSYCITYFSFRDIMTIQTMIHKDENLDKENKEKHLEKLQQVLAYCDNITDCRRKLVLSYFNEDFDSQLCNKNCDNCRNNVSATREERDVTDIAKQFAGMVEALVNERITLIHFQDIFKGSRSSKIIHSAHDKLPFHGVGSKLTKSYIERLAFRLLSLHVIEEYSVMNNKGFATNYVRKGSNFRKLMNNQLQIKMDFTTPNNSRPSTVESSTYKNKPLNNEPGKRISSSSLNTVEHIRSFTYHEESEKGMSTVQPISLQRNFEVRSTQDMMELSHAYNKLKDVCQKCALQMNPPVSVFLPDHIVREIATRLPVSEDEFCNFPNVGPIHKRKFKFLKPTIMELRKRRIKNIGYSQVGVILSDSSTLPDFDSVADKTASKYFSSDNRRR